MAGEADRTTSIGGAIVWIAMGMLAGTLAGLELGSTADPNSTAPCRDRAVDLAVIVVLLALAALIVTRGLRSTLLPRGLWLVAAAAFGIVNAVQSGTFLGEDTAHRVYEGPILVSIEGVVLEDAIDHGRPREASSPGAPLLDAFAHAPITSSFMLLTNERVEREQAFRLEARRYDVRVAGRAFPIRAGDRVRVRGWIEPDEPPRHPGAFDASAWRRRRGVAGLVEVPDPTLVVRLADTAHGAHSPRDDAGSACNDAAPDSNVPIPELSPGDRLRAALARGLTRALGDDVDPATRDLLVTMTLGTRGETLPDVKALFARTGLSHFIVISGFHLAVLAAAILIAARRAGAGRRVCGAVLVGASIIFLYVLESQTSIVRAGAAGVVAGTAMMLNRGWPPLSVLALVTTVALFADPRVAGEPSFQLSYGVVAALLVLARPIERCLVAALESLSAPRSWLVHRRGVDIRRLPGRRLRARGEARVRAAAALGFRSTRALEYARRDTLTHPDGLRRVVVGRMLARPSAAAIAAWIVASPITLHHFGQVSPWAIVGSVLLAPIASAIAIVGTATAPLAILAPALAVPLGGVLAAMGRLLLFAVECCAELPGSCLSRPLQPGWWAIAVVSLPFMSVILAAALAPRRRTRGADDVDVDAAGADRRATGGTARMVSGALTIAWLILATVPWWPAGPATVEVIALDLGRGRCVVVRGPDGTVMIDGGSPQSANVGARTIVPALLAMGVARLDAVVLTDRTMASLSGVFEVVRSIPTLQLVAPASLLETRSESPPQLLLGAVAALGVPTRFIDDDDSIEIPIMHEAPSVALALRPRRTRKDGPARLECSLEGSIAGLSAVLDTAMSTQAAGDSRGDARGARWWRAVPLDGWTAARFGRDGWMPMRP